ncbi:MAG TPA: cytochrome P450 [Pseudonocardiaceae bacterium]|jgi:cytochrome P450|nr:cytochrome P450 [Pseudonocardiaceae bacterium]
MGAAAEQTDVGASEVVAVPGRWPLLGHTPSLLRQRFRFTSGLRDRGAVVKIYLGPLPAYALTTPELVHRMLVTEAGKFEKGILFDRFRPHFGNGLAMSNGGFHLRQRRLMQPAFHRDRIATYAATMVDAADELISAWRPGQVVAVDKDMQKLAVAIVGRTLFATELGTAAIAEAQRSMPIVIKQGMIRALSPKFMETLPIPGNRRFDNAIARLREVVGEVIVAGRTQGTDNGDLLSMLLLARDADTGEVMTDQQVYDEVVTLLTGGIETTGLALAWLFHELAENPDVARRLHAEVDEVLAGRAATIDDLPRLTYTRQVVDEVLRRYPIWLLMRRTTTEVDLDGVRLPAGTEVVFSPHALHHDPRNFTEPHRFDPDRWSAERVGEIPKGAFIPFGSGARQCIGNAFAQTEIALVAATITARWQLVPVPGKPVRIKVTGAAYPSRLPMTVTPRQA